MYLGFPVDRHLSWSSGHCRSGGTWGPRPTTGSRKSRSSCPCPRCPPSTASAASGWPVDRTELNGWGTPGSGSAPCWTSRGACNRHWWTLRWWFRGRGSSSSSFHLVYADLTFHPETLDTNERYYQTDLFEVQAPNTSTIVLIIIKRGWSGSQICLGGLVVHQRWRVG